MTEMIQMRLGRMMANVGRLQATRLDQMMDEIGLFRGQAILLLLLGEQDEMTHSEIAERLQISPAAATKVIKRMEALGYVRRTADAQDERVSRVVLEDAGREKIAQIQGVFERINALLVQGIPEEQLRVYREVLGKMHGNLLSTEGNG